MPYLSVSLLVTMSKPSPVLAGNQFSLNCEIDLIGFNLVNPTIKWFGPDCSTYIGNSEKNKHTLTVSDVSGIQNGKWTCEVSNKQPNGAVLKATTDVIIVGK